MGKRTVRVAWPPLGIHPLSVVKAAYIAHVLNLAEGNVSEAARLLQVQRYTVRAGLRAGKRKGEGK